MNVTLLLTALLALGNIAALVLFVRYARCGLDSLDEGMHLNTYTYPEEVHCFAAHDFIYSGRLYQLLGGDLRNMRLVNLGLSLLSNLFFWAGFTVFLWRMVFPGQMDVLMALNLLLALSLVSFLRFSFIYPTPTYDYYNTGAILGACGFVLLASALADMPLAAAGCGLVGGALLSLSFFNRFPAFFAAWPLLAGFLILSSIFDSSGPWPAVVGMVIGTTGGFLLHFALLVPIRAFKARLTAYLKYNALRTRGDISAGALLPRYGKDLWTFLSQSARALRLELAAALLLGPLGALVIALWGPQGARECISWLGGVLLIWIMIRFFFKNQAEIDKPDTNYSRVMRGLWDIFSVAVVLTVSWAVVSQLTLSWSPEGPLANLQFPWGHLGLAVLLLLALSVTASFGSNSLLLWNVVYVPQFWAGPMFALGLAALLALDAWPIWIACLLLPCGYCFQQFLRGYIRRPFLCTPDKRQCTQCVRVGPIPAPVNVTAEEATFIGDYLKLLGQAGFAPGMDMLNLFAPPILCFLPGGRSLGMPYYFHQPGKSLDGFAMTLSMVAPDRLRNCFLVKADDLEQYLLDRLHASGINFPDGYESVGELTWPYNGHTVQIYRPHPSGAQVDDHDATRKTKP